MKPEVSVSGFVLVSPGACGLSIPEMSLLGNDTAVIWSGVSFGWPASDHLQSNRASVLDADVSELPFSQRLQTGDYLKGFALAYKRWRDRVL